MRQIDSFVVTRTSEILPEVEATSRSRGLIYPYPHIYIYKMDENEEEYAITKLRPMGERCATVRDSRLNNFGIGIVVKCNSEILTEKLSRLLATTIKILVDDLCIKKYKIYSDEINLENFIDTFWLDSKIALAPSMFTRLI